MVIVLVRIGVRIFASFFLQLLVAQLQIGDMGYKHEKNQKKNNDYRHGISSRLQQGHISVSIYAQLCLILLILNRAALPVFVSEQQLYRTRQQALLAEQRRDPSS